MRFIIIHKTSARWEAGERPDSDLIADVGKLIGDLKTAGALRAGEGLRASSHGARLTFRAGVPHVAPGPFIGTNELTAGFDIIRAGTLGEAVGWASEVGRALGDVEIDVRPVTEPWDIGLAPEPEELTSRRFMVQRKANVLTESGAPLGARIDEALATIQAQKDGDLLTTETVRQSSRGRRCTNTTAGLVFTDGPFTESKELIAGYVIVEVASQVEASRWVERYVKAVRGQEADLLELEER
jgi:hypothetical protein